MHLMITIFPSKCYLKQNINILQLKYGFNEHPPIKGQ